MRTPNWRHCVAQCHNDHEGPYCKTSPRRTILATESRPLWWRMTLSSCLPIDFLSRRFRNGHEQRCHKHRSAVALNTRGRKDACSTSHTLSSYGHLFSRSCLEHTAASDGVMCTIPSLMYTNCSHTRESFVLRLSDQGAVRTVFLRRPSSNGQRNNQRAIKKILRLSGNNQMITDAPQNIGFETST